MLIYVIDTVRCIDPTTFMSNMTYACSILYKTQLPFLIAFNKIDVQSHLFAVEWMHNIESFEYSMTHTARNKDTYMSTLMKSLGHVLDAFYKNISQVGVSSITGQGINDLFTHIDICKLEYWKEFFPALQKRLEEKQNKTEIEKRTKIQQAFQKESKKLIIQDKEKGMAVYEEIGIQENTSASQTNDKSELDTHYDSVITSAIATDNTDNLVSTQQISSNAETNSTSEKEELITFLNS
ncbi:XPA-binding protein [Reticulomyxa filosa]|uniref:GPN-loop GTPase n=1 Tax=Reticulomyxa filosa TaxID=46433 RepID=X6M4A9_RETFI|nr:XPA-binding protein [Reticulomyxa filosa]|eukprot:ETO08764.1 XPA-binding protein [Reticulomyxa filosa]